MDPEPSSKRPQHLSWYAVSLLSLIPWLPLFVALLVVLDQGKGIAGAFAPTGRDHASRAAATLFYFSVAAFLQFIFATMLASRGRVSLPQYLVLVNATLVGLLGWLVTAAVRSLIATTHP